MAELKTRQTRASVDAFLATLPEDRRADCQRVSALMKKVTGEAPRMWGTSIVGFGVYRYPAAGGRTNEWPLTGFSPRKQNLTLYIMPGFEAYTDLLQKLGRFKTGKSCLYVKSLADVDVQILERLVKDSVTWMKKRFA